MIKLLDGKLFDVVVAVVGHDMKGMFWGSYRSAAKRCSRPVRFFSDTRRGSEEQSDKQSDKWDDGNSTKARSLCIQYPCGMAANKEKTAEVCLVIIFKMQYANLLF